MGVENLVLSEATLANNVLALQLTSMGMTQKCVDEFVPGTYKNSGRFKKPSNSIQFTRGASVVWTKTKLGFKYSNILFNLYVKVAGKNALSHDPEPVDIMSTFTAAQLIYPELLKDKICDITRFAYLIRSVLDHTVILDKCNNKKCSNQFIFYTGAMKRECWHCVEKREVGRFNKEQRAIKKAKENNSQFLSPVISAKLVSNNIHVDSFSHLPKDVLLNKVSNN